MEFRKAKISDVPGIARLYLQFWETHLGKDPLIEPAKRPTLANQTAEAKKDIRKRNCFILVAAESENILGYIEITIKRPPALFKIRKSAYIDSLVTDQKHRRSKIGSELLNHASAFLKKKGISHVKTNIYLFNKPARSFWRKSGFEDISVLMVKGL